MAKVDTYLHALNIGVQDKRALARVDLERMRLAAEIQTNWMCMATGPAFMRPGLQYITSTAGNAVARLKEFIFGVSDAALLEFSANTLRVMVNDQIITRAAVSSTVTNGDFSSGTGWSTTGVANGTSVIAGGKLTMNAQTIEGIAKCSRSVTTASAGTEHAVRIIVDRGPVQFRCGSSLGEDDYIEETTLGTGSHSLAFTPAGTYYVEFSSKDRVSRIVDSIQVEGAGVMQVPTPWGLSNLSDVRISQSADVCFVACDGFQQRRIERRGLRSQSRSWSVALYTVDDGPFSSNPDPNVRLRPTVLDGNGNLLASDSYFTADDVGRIFRLVHTGQNIAQKLAQEDVYSDPIRVTGLATDRAFAYSIAGTWSGTVTLERSYDAADSGFVIVEQRTGNGLFAINDGSDNAIYWYRLGFRPNDYVSGEADVAFGYDGGGGVGICRAVAFNSSTNMDMEILRPVKSIVFTRNWQPGEWSARSDWPSAVSIADGRLWWSGEDRIWGGVSDAFASFDEDTEGDSGPISRSIATGGVNSTKWLMSLKRLLAGTEGAVATIRSSSLDEPITPTNFGIKDSSTTGVAAVDPIKVDGRGIFVERAGSALLELTFDGQSSDYIATQISKLTTDIFSSGVRSIAIQRRPDTRIWLVLNDGSAVCMVYEPDQQVLAFIPIETDGSFESVAVLPALVQDRVYCSIMRTVNGSPVRYIEKMALDTDVKPTTLCKVMDAYSSGINSPASTTIPVGLHLQGEGVVVWADGAPLLNEGEPLLFTVNGSGNITVPTAVTNWVAGLPYRARYKSARLAYAAQGGTAMLQKKKVDSLGMIITDFVRTGIRYGRQFDNAYRPLDRLPIMVDNAVKPAIVLSDINDEEPVPFDGEWDMDSRVCLECSSPSTATILGLVLSVTTN